MLQELEGKNIAILVTDGFEQVEMVKPRQALVNVPDDYLLPPDAQQLLDSVKELEFSQKLVFIKDVVGLGAAQSSGDNV